MRMNMTCRLITATMVGGIIGSAAVQAADLSIKDGQKLAAYNKFLRTLAKEKGCLLADLNADMQAAVKKGGSHKKGNLMTIDGVHMNPAGNVMMATGVLKAFGLSAEQIAKAKKSWPDAPPKTAPTKKQKK